MSKSDENTKLRFKFSHQQIKTLESFFEEFEFIDNNQARHLAREMGASTRQIRNWFQNKRAAIRRKNLKECGAVYPIALKLPKNWGVFRKQDIQLPESMASSSQCQDDSSNANLQVEGQYDYRNPTTSSASSCTVSPSTSPSSPSTSLHPISSGTSPSSSCYHGSPGTSSASSFYSTSPGTSPSFGSFLAQSSTSSNVPYYQSSSAAFNIQGTVPSLVVTDEDGCLDRPLFSPTSTSSWRLPLTELSLNSVSENSSIASTPDQDPSPSSYQTTRWPVDIDWAFEDFSTHDSQMGSVYEYFGSETGSMANTENTRKMAVQSTEDSEESKTKSFINLDASAIINVSTDDAITTCLSELETEHEPQHREVQNIINYLKHW